MAKAFAGSHGQFRAKAKAAGKSTAAFASEHAGDSGRLGQQARLAEVGMAAHKPKSSEDRMRGRYAIQGIAR